MATVNLGGMEPQVILSGKLKGQFIILAVIAAHINGIAISGLKAHGRYLGGLHLPLAGLLADIATGLQLLANFLQLRIGVRTIQFFQNRLEVLQFLFADLNLLGQLLLRGLHTGIVLVKLCRILLGRQNGRDGHFNFRHVLIIKVLHLYRGLAFLNAVDIGSEDIAQLAQTLPIKGSFQFLLLDGKLSGQALAQILDSFTHRLALLAHSVLPVTGHIEAVQKSAKGFSLLHRAILADGTEGKLLGRAVGGSIIIRRRMLQMFTEEQTQFLRNCLGIHAFHSGIGFTGSKERSLSANQRRQAAKGVHQPVCQEICPGKTKHFLKILINEGIFFRNGVGQLVVHARQRRALGGFVQAHTAQAIDDPVICPQNIQVAGSAHQLRHQFFLDAVAHFVDGVEGEDGAALHRRLLNIPQSAAGQVLTQQHAEHRGFRRILRLGIGQMQTGRRGACHKLQLIPAFRTLQVHDHRVPHWLVDLLHSGVGAAGANLIQNRF